MLQPPFILGLSGLSRFSGACVATIGSFDGVHLGHQQILQRVVDRAKCDGLLSVVMVFEPQPQEFFAKAPSRPRLMRLREKVSAILDFGIDTVVCMRFNPAFRSLTADAFIDQVLVEGLSVRHLEIGDDFRFGCDRGGDFALLKQSGAQRGFTVAKSQTYLYQGQRVSSTRIRKLLANNQLAEAEHLLAKPYSICGRVIYGRQLGRTIGVPTANIGLGRYCAAVNGVYAVEVNVDGCHYRGVANVGVKPTVSGQQKPVLEVHLFDFNAQLYGHFITVNFRKAIREEQKFPTVDALKAQIALDIRKAKEFFN